MKAVADLFLFIETLLTFEPLIVSNYNHLLSAVPSIILFFVELTSGVSNRWNGIWNGTMEWKMEWNGEHTQLQLTRVTGAAQSRLNYLVYL